MEGRVRSLLLSFAAGVLATVITPLNAADLADEQVETPIIQPQIERMDFEESRINKDNVEIIASIGIISIEDFGVNPVFGGKVAYRVSEGFFVDAEFGFAKAQETTAESFLGIDFISDDEREYKYLVFNLGYDVFPGETFMTDNLTYNTAFYVVAGLGNTKFAGSDNFTFTWGAGYRIMAANSLAIYFDVRDHAFTMDVVEDKLANNIEITFGFGMYF